MKNILPALGDVLKASASVTLDICDLVQTLYVVILYLE